MSARPFVYMELESHWTDFHINIYLDIFRKSFDQLQDSSKQDKKKLYFTWRPIYIFDYISLSSP
jgi:uncharacterized membrane protein YukC